MENVEKHMECEVVVKKAAVMILSSTYKDHNTYNENIVGLHKNKE